MTEQLFENILCKYPELIEENLKFLGRQVHLGGKFVDLLFEDRHGIKLVIELKVGTIKREHVAQLMDYLGHFLSPEDNSTRGMIIGNHMPQNFAKSLDLYGFEWKVITFQEIKEFLKSKKDTDLLDTIETKCFYKDSKVSKTRVTSAQYNNTDNIETSLSDGTKYSTFVKSKKMESSKERFWIGLLNKTEELCIEKNLTLNFTPTSEGRYSRAPSGLPGIKYTYAFAGDTAWVEVTIGSKKGAVIYNNLLKHRKRIDDDFHKLTGDHFKWDKEDHFFGKNNRKEFRITTNSKVSFNGFSFYDPALIDDLTNRMVSVTKSFWPTINKIKGIV